LEVSERTPAQPTTMRRTAHPTRKAPTTAMLRPWRTTTPSPSLHVSPATSTSEHATQRTLAHLYAGLFTQVRGRRFLRTSPLRSSKKFGKLTSLGRLPSFGHRNHVIASHHLRQALPNTFVGTATALLHRLHVQAYQRDPIMPRSLDSRAAHGERSASGACVRPFPLGSWL
jgi:hypothetical protein